MISFNVWWRYICRGFRQLFCSPQVLLSRWMMVVMMAPWILMEVRNDGLAKEENKEELVIQPYEPWEKLSSAVSGRCCEKNISDPEKKNTASARQILRMWGFQQQTGTIVKIQPQFKLRWLSSLGELWRDSRAVRGLQLFRHRWGEAPQAVMFPEPLSVPPLIPCFLEVLRETYSNPVQQRFTPS